MVFKNYSKWLKKIIKIKNVIKRNFLKQKRFPIPPKTHPPLLSSSSHSCQLPFSHKPKEITDEMASRLPPPAPTTLVCLKLPRPIRNQKKKADYGTSVALVKHPLHTQKKASKK